MFVNSNHNFYFNYLDFQTRKHSQLLKSFIEQLENRKEFQSMGAVDKSIYKAYFKSAESPILLSAVVILFVMGQIAISAIDLIVSKWFVDSNSE